MNAINSVLETVASEVCLLALLKSPDAIALDWWLDPYGGLRALIFLNSFAVFSHVYETKPFILSSSYDDHSRFVSQ